MHLKFLLVAPASEVGSVLIHNPQNRSVSNQSEHNVRYLNASVTSHVFEVTRFEGFSVSSFEVHELLGAKVLTAVVDHPLKQKPRSKDDVTRLETALSKMMVRLKEAFTPDIGELRWIARFALGSVSASFRGLWMSTRNSALNLSNGMMRSSFLTVGWGNGVISGWSTLPDPQKSEIISGFVDAQVLWCQLEDLIQASRTPLMDSYSKRSIRFKKSTSWYIDFDAKLQQHKLYFTDLKTGMQGVRRDVALHLLQLWGYEDLVKQTESDLLSFNQHIESKHRLQSSRYQTAVEIVLLSLTLLTIVELVFVWIQTSYAGVDGTIGSDERPWSLFGLARRTDPDVWLISSIVVLFLIALSLRFFGIEKAKKKDE